MNRTILLAFLCSVPAAANLAQEQLPAASAVPLTSSEPASNVSVVDDESRFDDPKDTSPGGAAANDGGQIKTFALKHSQATSAAELLQQLMINKPFRAVADERTNSVIVMGTAAQMLAVEALLLKLDEAKIASGQKVSDAAIKDYSPKETQHRVAELRNEYESKNTHAHKLGESLRQTPDAAKKVELRTAVQQAFTLRQSLLRAELLEMQTRLLETQRSIDMRERIADQIVDRRIEDLLNPQLGWEGSPAAALPEKPLAESSHQSAATQPPAPIGLGLPQEIDQNAWGEPQHGLRLAIVVKSENSLWKESQEVQFVVENVSQKAIVLRGQRNDQLATLFEIRQTSQAQVQTLPRVDSGVGETGNAVKLLPGQQAVIGRVWIGVLEAETDGIPGGNPQLLVIDPDAWKFQNKIYLVRGCLQPDPDQPTVMIRSGQVGIAFHKPANATVLDLKEGHLRVPITLPEATEAQRLRWRSGIVEIFAETSTPEGTRQHAVGTGILVSREGLILSQLRQHRNGSKYLAHFDDGSYESLELVEESGAGFIAFKLPQGTEVNHHFPFVKSGTMISDEVYAWGQDISQPDHKLRLFKSQVVLLDRQVVSMGLRVWQLSMPDSFGMPITGPVLNAEGELLGLIVRDSGDLLLAVPTGELKSMFPKALGQEKVGTRTTSVMDRRAPDEIAERLKALQGTWTIGYFASADDEQPEKPHSIRITGNKLSLVWPGAAGQQLERIEKMQIDLTYCGDDRAIDFHDDNTFEDETSFTIHGIYEIEDETLALCFARRGPRPLEFGAEGGNQTTCLRAIRDEVASR